MSGPHVTYGTLVKDEGDMVGHVAYALYKRDKLSFIQAVRDEKGRAPTDEEVWAFIVSSNLGLRIDAYRSEAEQALQVLSGELLQGAAEELGRQYQQELTQQLQKAKSFFRAVAESLLANLLAVAVIALVAVVLYGTRIGFVGLAADVFGYEVKARVD